MVREGTPFTMACWSSIIPNRAPRRDRIGRMFEAGLNIILGTDDPTMFGTTMGHCWRTVFAHTGWGMPEARKLSLSGVDASWLSEPEKAALRSEFEALLNSLDAALNRSDQSLDLSVERPRPSFK